MLLVVQKLASCLKGVIEGRVRWGDNPGKIPSSKDLSLNTDN